MENTLEQKCREAGKAQKPLMGFSERGRGFGSVTVVSFGDGTEAHFICEGGSQWQRDVCGPQQPFVDWDGTGKPGMLSFAEKKELVEIVRSATAGEYILPEGSDVWHSATLISVPMNYFKNLADQLIAIREVLKRTLTPNGDDFRH